MFCVSWFTKTGAIEHPSTVAGMISVATQSDISAIDHWVHDNFLSFNPGKCCTMFISRKSLHSNPPSTLFLGSSALTRVNFFKYLGVTLSSDLSWSLHVRNINAKARKLVSLLYRRFHFCSTPTLVTLYTSFIRPHLEYASQVWDTFLLKDINLLHNTQIFALRVCTKNWSSPSSILHEQLSCVCALLKKACC